MVAATDGPVRAMEDGRVVGVVDRETVLSAMVEHPQAGEAEPGAPGRAGRLGNGNGGS